MKPSRSFCDGWTSLEIDDLEVEKPYERPSRLGMKKRVRLFVRAHLRKNTEEVLVTGALAGLWGGHCDGLKVTLSAVGSMVDVGPAGSLVRGRESRGRSN